jgi:hypothetical protein
MFRLTAQERYALTLLLALIVIGTIGLWVL